VAAPRRRLPLLRLAALPAARAERRAGGGVENGFYVRGLRAEARLAAVASSGTRAALPVVLQGPARSRSRTEADRSW
jgi:hypothetical protein